MLDPRKQIESTFWHTCWKKYSIFNFPPSGKGNEEQ